VRKSNEGMCSGENLMNIVHRFLSEIEMGNSRKDKGEKITKIQSKITGIVHVRARAGIGTDTVINIPEKE